MTMANQALQQLESCDFFSALPPRYLSELQMQGTIKIYPLEENESVVLRSQGEGDAIIVLRGQARLSLSDGDGSSPGASRVITSTCHPVDFGPSGSVTIDATAPSTALCRTNRDHLDFLVSWVSLIDGLPSEKAELAARLTSLHNPSVLMRLPFEKIEDAFRRMERIQVKAGEDVVRQGDAGDRFYIIESGEAEVWQQGLYDDEQKQVALLKKGHHFGDEALLTGGTRNATVRMSSDGNLLSLGKGDFLQLISTELVHEVDAAQAKELMAEGCRLIDVRYPEEYEEGHLPDVTLIPLPDLRGHLDELNSDDRYLTYCLSGKRSAVAAMIMRQHGLSTVCLRGGIRDWPDPLVA